MKSNILKILNNIWEFLRQLPNKPESERRFWFLIFFVIVMTLIVIIWALNVNRGLDSINPAPDESDISFTKEDVGPSIFSILWQGLRNVSRGIFDFWERIGGNISWMLAKSFSFALQIPSKIYNIF